MSADKFPETKNQELRGLYINRATKLAFIEKRKNRQGLTQDEEDARQSSLRREGRDLKEIESRIAALERAEEQAAAVEPAAAPAVPETAETTPPPAPVPSAAPGKPSRK